MSKQRIGFTGVGLMGHGMAKNILAAGFPLTIMANRNRGPVEDLIGMGAAEAATPKAVAAVSDIVFTCLPNSPIVEQVLLGEDGVRSGAAEGTIVVECTTADPTSTLRIAEQLTAAGIGMVDGPLTRTPKEAEAGMLNILLGGEPETLAELQPVLESFCENIFHIGALGAGHSIKLINNFMSMTLAATTAEMVTAARKSGVDLNKLQEVIGAGALNSGMFQIVMKYPLEGDPTGLKFVMANAKKDVTYYQNMVSAVNMTSPLSSGVFHAFSQANSLGMGGEYVPKLIDALGRINGLEDLDAATK